MTDLEFKPKFVERYSKLTDFDVFSRICGEYLRRSVRINTLKRPIAEVKKRLEKNWKLTPIPWCNEGFWVESERRDIGNTLEHALGYIYVQEAASMIPPLVLAPKPGETILDMCAAPGSKATQIAQYMKNQGTLVANDYTGLRLRALGINIQRCGINNALITRMFGHQFAKTGIKFDRVLVDAPCSGTGTIRKSWKTLRIWNPGMMRRLAATQKKLVLSGFDSLRQGGTLVYSTCSLEPEEDEGVVDHLLREREDAKIRGIELDLKRSPAIMGFDGKDYVDEVKHCLRLWPQDNDTEGFFVAKIKNQTTP
ncbi:MAG: NOL1/NOP2/sun family putative RNA methylase [Nanoarchaeota archaeon]|nr:NOL1/NOP2/sun family putative RNA methylase [Nanoarchaeota archaeon]